MTRTVDPLNNAVPIVDQKGRPTQQFLRQWSQLRAEVARIEVEVSKLRNDVDDIVSVPE